MKLLEKNGQVEEHLELEFHGRTKLYVPAAKIGLVQKYVGGAKSRPTLAKLGGRIWGRQKQSVEEAVTDLAAEMLEVQAARASRPGIAFPADTEWQREFDASFPYHETADQLTTIEADQARHVPGPADGPAAVRRRGLRQDGAGDAGGVQGGRCRLPGGGAGADHPAVPSSTSGRSPPGMAEFPFEIAALSRFATRRQQTEIIQRLASGAVDIVIGTHRLVQPDVRFHNLGLVIIDEEQRFGVEVKERLKALRQTVDVLTMTATPIPRTLHMGLLGLRDISNLETPPEDRLAVETRVGAVRRRADPPRRAARTEPRRADFLRPQPRPGHRDRRPTAAADRARGPAGRRPRPDGRRRAGAGRCSSFVDRRCDMLLATTIIESGLDIPNANTMFIDEADRYGLADLHQLRGRVGRYKHRAYCYLLVDPNKNLSPSAARRLRAIEEFSDMGAGFAIAMRDLEIRGAGNILGTRAERTHRHGRLRAVLRAAGTGRLPSEAPAAAQHRVEVDVDLPGKGYIPAVLCARHAAEDRSLPAARPGEQRRGIGRHPGGTGSTALDRRRRSAAPCRAGRDAGCRPRLGNYVDSPGGSICRVPVLVRPADSTIGRRERRKAARGRRPKCVSAAGQRSYGFGGRDRRGEIAVAAEGK